MKINQFSLFKQEEKRVNTSLPAAAKKASSFPNIGLSFALDRAKTLDDGMMVLRILGNRYAKSLYQKKGADKDIESLFLTLKNEIRIKKGILPQHACLQDEMVALFTNPSPEKRY